MRVWALIFILFQTLWGYTYNELLLDAQSRIYPKLLMLEEKIVHKHDKKPIVFTVVYEPEDRLVAERIVEKIENYYDHSLGGVGFEVDMATFDELDSLLHADALYLLKGDESSVKKAVEFANRNGVPIFVYDFKDLDEGALFALTIEQSTVIYLNRKALHRANVSFDSALYAIVRFIDAG
ncbi:MAG: hypothetical protein L3J42_06900 [Hydrogenimonas sp.]|nr:hypothetical protein [Hydrogenimonas sp.]